MSEVSKAYEPQLVEQKWYDFWLQAGSFTADPASPKPAYSIVIPPPNVTGVLHLGHVLNNTIQDILARKARMEGKEVLWLPGTDHAGIGTQTVVEKALRKEGLMKHRDDLGREKFLEYAWAWKEKYAPADSNRISKVSSFCRRPKAKQAAHVSPSTNQSAGWRKAIDLSSSKRLYVSFWRA